MKKTPGGVNPTHGRTVTASAVSRKPLLFDGTHSNDERITRLLAALTSAAGDHTDDKVARQMIRNATAELFDAAARLGRIGRCGHAAVQLHDPSLVEGV